MKDRWIAGNLFLELVARGSINFRAMPTPSTPRSSASRRRSRPLFPTTRWTLLRELREDGDEYRNALQDLLQRYWRPLYKFIRHVWGKSDEDAKDLTQEFFLHVIRRKLLERADPSRGSLRSLLKAALRNFLSNVQKERYREKRGGGIEHVPIHNVPSDEMPSEAKEDESFDAEWRTLLVRRAVARVRASLLRKSKAAHYRAFEAIDLETGAKPTYSEVARSLGVKESDVRNYLTYARSLFKRALMDEITQYSDDAGAAAGEFTALFGG